MLKEYIQGVRSLSIIGMCKNAGKTTVLNKLIAELNESRVRLGLTSIGRDGESTDLVTRTAKPGIYVYEGTLVATAVDMFRLSDIPPDGAPQWGRSRLSAPEATATCSLPAPA